MADMKDDPSLLYDEEFMKKREEMFKNFSSDNEISSGRDEDDLFSGEEEQEEAPKKSEKKGGLFSKLRKKKDYEEDFGYDIFDLGDVDEKELLADENTKKEKKKRKKSRKKDNKEKSEDYISVSDLKAKEEQSKDEDAPLNNEASFETETEIEKVEQGKTVQKEETKEIEAEKENEKQSLNDKTEETEILSGEDLKEMQSYETDKSLDDINALLESVGIKPMGKDDEIPAESGATKKIETDTLKALSKTSSDSETKVFASANNESKKDTSDFDDETEKSNQLILEGFSDEEAPLKEDEEEAKEKLKTSRKNLIDNFRVLKNNTEDSALLEREENGINSDLSEEIDTEDGEGIFEAVEKINKNRLVFGKLGEKAAVNKIQQKAKKQRQKEQALSATALAKELKKERSLLQKKIKISVLVTALLSLVTLICSSYTEGGAFEKIMGRGARIYILIHIAFLAFEAFVCKDKIKSAFNSITSLKADSNASVLITAAFVALHLIISLVSGIYTDTSLRLYTPYALFAFLVSLYCDYVSVTDKAKSVSLMLRSKELSGLCAVSNKADAASLAHGISENGEPIIYYSADVSFPEKMGTKREEKASDQKFYAVFLLSVGAVGLVISLVLSLINKSAWIFSSFLAGFVCLLMPNMKSLVSVLLMSKTNSSLVYNSSVITSFDACDEIGKANAVVAETKDLFVSGVSKFKLAYKSKMALSDAVVYAASTLKNTSCLIKDAFDDFLEESGITLPEAEDVTYEDRLGYSSWVAGRRVLVGNRQMLVQHSIVCPSEEEEYLYAKGKSVMYVVVEGVIAATFIVTFSPKTDIQKHIYAFNKTGLILMLISADPWLNEDNAAMKLRIDKATVKIASSKGMEIISSYKNTSQKDVTSTLVSSKKHKNIISLVNSAYNLYLAQKMSLLIYTVGIVLSFILLTAFSFLKISLGFSEFVCIVLQLIWAAVSYYAGSSRL